jgi:3-phosphoshikimate 1-carboxyvinyltransferase
MAKGLRAAGVTVDEGPDWWRVTGLGHGNVPGGVTAASQLDHRIAMAFMVMGMASQKPMAVDDGSPIATSFPIFEKLMGDLGADVVRESL